MEDTETGWVYCNDCMHQGLKIFGDKRMLPTCCEEGIKRRIRCGYFESK